MAEPQNKELLIAADRFALSEIDCEMREILFLKRWRSRHSLEGVELCPRISVANER